jgi:hypothetical protein
MTINEQNANLECPPSSFVEPAEPAPAPLRDPTEDTTIDIDRSSTIISQKATFVQGNLFGNPLPSLWDGFPTQAVNVGFMGWTKFFQATAREDEQTLAYAANNPEPDNASVEDKLRFRGRRSWVYHNNKLILLKDYANLYEIPPPFNVGILEDQQVTTEDLQNTNLDTQNPRRFSNNAIRTRLRFYPTFLLTSHRKMGTYILGDESTGFEPTIKQNKYFYDHTFDLDLPFSTEITAQFPNLLKAFKYHSKSKYNKFVESYEQNIPNLLIDERIMPNLYSIFTYDLYLKNSDTPASRFSEPFIDLKKDATDLVLLEGALSDVFNTDGEGTSGTGLKIKGNLFNSFVSSYLSISQETIDRTIKKQSNVVLLHGLDGQNGGVISRGATRDLSFQYGKSFFPMYAQISFKNIASVLDTERDNFAHILNRTTYSIPLVKEIIQDIRVEQDPERSRGAVNFPAVYGMESSSVPLTHQDINFRQDTQKIVQASQDVDNPKSDLGSTQSLQDVRMWNLGNWIELFETHGKQVYDKVDDSIISFLGFQKDNYEIFSDNDLNRDIKPETVNKFILSRKLREMVDQHQRSWREVWDGKKAYSETIFFRVEKKDTQGSKIQDYYFIASSNIDIFEWIDTQIIFGKQYTYSVYAYQAIVGTKYRYDHGDMHTLDFRDHHGNFDFFVHHQPTLMLAEVLYFESNITVYDDPPIEPTVRIFTHRNRADKISFLLEDGAGQATKNPIVIYDSDNIIFDRVRRHQNKETGEPLLFSADDRIVSYDIFRLDHKPTSYKDFKAGYRGQVFTVIENKNYEHICSTKASSATFVDLSIRPNIKYYYTFRSSDLHGNFSNPTSIFEIELIETNGIMTPVVEVYRFPFEKINQHENFRRYLFISPSGEQSLIDNDTSEKIEGLQARVNSENFTSESIFEAITSVEPELGEVEEKVWKQKFKIRITSKSTGRKVDFNIKFDHKKVQKVENAPCGDSSSEDSLFRGINTDNNRE